MAFTNKVSFIVYLILGSSYVYSWGFENSIYTIDYQTIDMYPLVGVSYYRLKQIDFDGTYSYSDVIAVHNDYVQKLDFVKLNYNNELRSMLVDVTLERPIGITIDIYDMLGRNIRSESVNGQRGHNQFTIGPIQNAGTYLVTIWSNSWMHSEKVFVSGVLRRFE